MDKRPIGVLDSGIGGLSVLNKVKRLLPNEDYIFYVDSIHNPYGNKTKEELIEIVDNIMNVLIEKNVKLVIVACNTASTQVISYLREKYPSILFVATEPAIKVAYDYYPHKNTLVMATPGTIASERLMLLDETYHQDRRTLLACSGLAELIEQHRLKELPDHLDNLFLKIERQKVEVVVLGCTHYPFIKEEIQKSLGHPVIFLDGAEGISKRVEFLLEQQNLRNSSKHKGSLSFILTNDKSQTLIDKYLDC